MKQEVIIIGGGAAGFFAAINIAENHPKMRVTILEKGTNILQKVKVSGGGRCNLTHACFTPSELVEFYPRGRKELLGPFHQFMCGDTMEWFENRGIPLKIEEDNRVFPVSNSSQTIVDCLMENAKNAGVTIRLNQKVESISTIDSGYKIITDKQEFIADKLLIATGSNSKIWEMMAELGHKIIAPVPSLFTFKIFDKRIEEIPGISVPNATISIMGSSFESSGPLLITHWGLSGPVVLKLSSFGALYLAENNYQYEVKVNWLSRTFDDVFRNLKTNKNKIPKKQIRLSNKYDEIPKRLWEKLVVAADIKSEMRWADVSNKQLENLADQITNSNFKAEGKTTFKEEFVIAGGIDLKEINFKRFESKLHKNLFFAGEVLNIDALTGGFNFQNAWTGAYIAGKAISESN